MVLYQCPRCGYSSKYKSSIKNHYNKKKVCQPILLDLQIKDCIEELNKQTEPICKYCNKVFSRNDNLKRHQQSCKDKKIYEDLEIENKYLKEQIENKDKIVEAERKKKEEKIKQILESPQQENLDIDQFIYIVQTREFKNSNQDIYKIGKTINPRNRLTSYPKGSKIFLIYPCLDCDTTEKNVIKIFSEKFIRRTDLGNEYFQGSVRLMAKEISDLIVKGI